MTTTTITIDPGTKTTGIAVFDGERLTDWMLTECKNRKDECGLMRAARMAGEVFDALIEVDPDQSARVVVEGPGSQSGHNRGGSLITMGAGVGAILFALRGWNTRIVDVGTWAKLGRNVAMAKRGRAELICAAFPWYDPDCDPGLDACDAIGLGWYVTRGK